MASNTNQGGRIDSDQREQYEYARRQIQRKKWLLRHFVLFTVGIIFFLLVIPFLDFGQEFLIHYWYRWVAFVWFLLFLIHAINVFVIDRFMGPKWEREQMDKLVAKQRARIDQLAQNMESDSKKNDTP